MTTNITIEAWQTEPRLSQHKLDLIKSNSYIKIQAFAAYLYEAFPDLDVHYDGLFSKEHLHAYLNQISLQMMLEQAVGFINENSKTMIDGIDDISINWGVDYLSGRLLEPFFEAFDPGFQKDYQRIVSTFLSGDLTRDDGELLKANFQHENLIDRYFNIPECPCCPNDSELEISDDEDALPEHYKELRKNIEGEI
tara:strand:- start:72 stop:656 length:585 start_codon:yes stop_codon:yes gene_type:complete